MSNQTVDLNVYKFLKRFDETKKALQEKCGEINKATEEIIRVNRAIRSNWPVKPKVGTAKPKLFVVK